MSEPDLGELVHVAGTVLTFGQYRRQRCSWCGALLQEYDLANISRPLEPGEDPDNPEPWEPAAWPVGGLVAVVDGGPRAMWVVKPEQIGGEPQAPGNSCMNLDREVTR